MSALVCDLAEPLPHGEVHVWHASLVVSADQLQQCWSVLAAEEHARAHKFHQAADQHRFTAARGLLRLLLGQYLRRPAAEVALVYGPAGKPALAPSMCSDLHFNLSHAGDEVSLAFCRSHAVGIDLEQVDGALDFWPLAEAHFSPAELRELCNLPAEQQRAAFYQGWTSKEAYLKALGTGLGEGTTHCTVALNPGAPPCLLGDASAPAAPAQWSLHALTAPPHTAACLAVQGHGWRVHEYQWTPPRELR